MKGLNISCEGSLKVKSYNDEFNLLLYKNNLEIMIQKINSGSSVWIDPAEDNTTVEFFYILKGSLKLIYMGETYNLKVGDSFYTEKLEDKIYLKIDEYLEMIYATNGHVAQEVFDFQNQLFQIINEVDSKDNLTARHSSRVRDYVEQICNSLSKKYQINYADVIISALLHDIGKSKIPDSILKKKEPLTRAEEEILKLHTRYGADIADKTYNSTVAQLILNHHERLDGSGPYGMKLDKLTIDDMIIIVANEFDILTHNRYGIENLSYIEAAEKLYNDYERFDRRVTTALVKLVKENIIK